MDSVGGVALTRLLHLASPGLPIGAFAYSQGLEGAVASGTVADEAAAEAWIGGLLDAALSDQDLPIFARLHAAAAAGDRDALASWNATLLASRATSELEAEDRHLGASLVRVLGAMGVDAAPLTTLATSGGVTYAAAFAFAAARFDVTARAAATAFAFAWIEAQTSAAIRLIPLGQSAGVRILFQLGARVPSVIDHAFSLGDDDIGAAAPAHALFSAAHETQYSRLFRS